VLVSNSVVAGCLSMEDAIQWTAEGVKVASPDCQRRA
jgi:hypothetical protein